MIIIMGVAGAGKSMQGKMVADQLGLPWLSTGEFLRMLISGDRRKDMIAGKLLADQEIIGLMRKILTVVDTNQEFVLDGFPRTVAQADWLLSQAKHGQLHITAVIHLHASEEVVEKRLLSRGRKDDSKLAIKERFKEYRETVIPILKELEDGGITVYEIDGEQDVQSVHADILDCLKKATT